MKCVIVRTVECRRKEKIQVAIRERIVKQKGNILTGKRAKILIKHSHGKLFDKNDAESINAYQSELYRILEKERDSCEKSFPKGAHLHNSKFLY